VRYRHVALLIGDDLRAAERYYARLFDLDVVLREGPLEPGASAWAQLPVDKTWDDAEAAGIEIGMVALARDDIIIALFASESTGEQLYAVGLLMTPAEIEEVATRLDDEVVEDHGEGSLAFIDRMGVRWQVSARGPFRGAGEIHGRWLAV
jgi:catechol 2,3-dioxygenase-like lactoylglutathione lyase family enzyme